MRRTRVAAVLVAGRSVIVPVVNARTSEHRLVTAASDLGKLVTALSRSSNVGTVAFTPRYGLITVSARLVDRAGNEWAIATTATDPDGTLVPYEWTSGIVPRHRWPGVDPHLLGTATSYDATLVGTNDGDAMVEVTREVGGEPTVLVVSQSGTVPTEGPMVRDRASVRRSTLTIRLRSTDQSDRDGRRRFSDIDGFPKLITTSNWSARVE